MFALEHSTESASISTLKEAMIGTAQELYLLLHVAQDELLGCWVQVHPCFAGRIWSGELMGGGGGGGGGVFST